MPRDRDSSSSGGGSDRSSGKNSASSLGRLDDAVIAKARLEPGERRRKAAERPWWFRLLDWLRQRDKYSD